MTSVDAAPRSSDFIAETIIRGRDVETYWRRQVVRQDLALLARVIYKQDPLYSLFKNQPYWYATLLCDAVLALFPCEHQQDTRGTTYCQDEVCIPPNARFPQLAGQWMLVGDVEAAVLSVVLAKFEEDRTKHVVEISKRDKLQKLWVEHQRLQAELDAKLEEPNIPLPPESESEDIST